MKKHVVTTTPHLHNPLQSKEFFRRFQTPFTLDNNKLTLNHFCASWKKYELFIDLFYERKVSTILLRTNQHSYFQVFVNEKLFQATNTIDMDHGKEFNISFDINVHARHIKVKWVVDTTDQACIFDIKVFSPISLLRSDSFFESELEDISHPFEYPTYGYNDYQYHIANFDHHLVIHFYDNSLRYLDMYTDTPIIWYTLHYESSMFFHMVVFRTGRYHETPDFYFFYQPSIGRKYIEYKEEGKRRIFSNDPDIMEWKIHFLKEAILAKSVKIFLLGYSPSFWMKINFRGYKSIHFEKTWTFLLKSIYIAVSTSQRFHVIDFEKHYHVYGFLTDNFQQIEEFCFMYEKNDGTMVYYKDQKSQSEITIFTSESLEIEIIPIKTKKIQFECFKFSASSSIILHVKGRETFEVVEWTSPSAPQMSSKLDANYLLKDNFNIIGLHGTIDNFNKVLPEDRLQTNHFGDSCLTRPDTCDDGFTIQFTKKGNFRPPTKDTFESAAYYINVDSKTAVEFHGSRLHIIFQNILMYSYAEVVTASMNFIYTAFDGDPTGIVYLHFTALPVNLLHESNLLLFNNMVSKMKNFSYIIKQDATNRMASIDLKTAFHESLSEIKNDVHHVVFWFFPSDTSAVTGDALSLRLSIQTRIKVPKSLSLLPYAQGYHTNFHFYAEFDRPSIITQVCFQHIHDLDFAFFYQLNHDGRHYDTYFFTRGQPRKVYVLTSTGRYLCFDFPYPLISENLHIVTSGNHITHARIFIVGSIFNEDSYYQWSYFPIFSAGLHGDHQERMGTGVTIYYSKKQRFLHALVQTQNKTFHRKIEIPSVDEEKIETYTITWNKETIMFYIDGKESAMLAMSVYDFNATPAFKQEYILLFGNYYNIFSYGSGSFLSFKLYHTVIQPAVTHRYQYNANLMGDEVVTRNFHKEIKKCVNVYCQQPDKVLDEITSLFYVGKVKILDENGANPIETEIPLISITNDSINAVILNVFIPSRQADISSVKLQAHIDNSNQKQCLLFIKEINHSVEFNVIQNHDLHEVLLTDHLKDFIEANGENSLSLNFTFDRKLCFDWEQTMDDIFLEIKYQLHVQGSPQLITYAHEGSHSSVTVKVHEETSCITFKYKQKGDGFAYISILSKDKSDKKHEIIHNERQPENIANVIEIQLNSSALPLELELVVVKNGLGDGYFVVTDIIQNKSTCGSPAIQNPVDNVLTVFWPVYRGAVESGLNRLLLLSFIESDEVAVLSHQFIKNHIFDANSFTKTEFLHGKSYSHYQGSMSFDFTFHFKEFSISFWLYLGTTETQVFSYRDGQSNNNLVEVYLFNNYVRITICNDEWRYDYTDINTWVPVSIVVFDSYYHAEVNNKVIATNQTYCGTMVFSQFFEMKQQAYIYCLQFYTVAFTEQQKQSSFICPTQYRGLSCLAASSGNCGYCDQLRNRWIPNMVLIDSCQSSVIAALNPSVYLQLEVLDRDGHIINDVTNEKMLFKKSDNTSVSSSVFGAVNRGFRFNEIEFYESPISAFPCGSVCTIAMWLKYLCTDLTDGKIFQTDFLLMKCKTVTSNEMPGDVEILTKSCSYTLKAPHGFWYHVAVAIENDVVKSIYVNGNISMYEDDCNKQMDVNSNVKLGFGSILEIDEIFLKENILSSDEMKDLFMIYTIGMSKAEFSRHTLPVWFRVGIKNVTSIDKQTVMIKGTKSRYKTLSRLKGLAVECVVDWNNIKMWNASGEVMADIPIYVRSLGENFLEEYQNELKKNGFTQPEIYKRHMRDDLVTAVDFIVRYSTVIIDPDSFSTNIKWQIWTKVLKVEFIGVYVDVILKNHLYDPSNLIDKRVYRTYSNNQYINLTNLVPYTKYEIRFYPHLMTGVTIDFPIDHSEEFETLEANPILSPYLNCSPAMNEISCHFFQLPKEFWHGNPYNYEVKFMKTSVSQENGLTSLFNTSDNATYSTMEVEFIPYGSETNIVIFNTLEIYEYFTIEIRATTNNGINKGVTNQTVIRSHIGAPDHPPEHFYMTYNNKYLSFYYEQYIDNIEYWNSDIEDSESWQFSITVTLHFGNKVRDIYNIPIGKTEHVHMNKFKVKKEIYEDIIVANISAHSNNYTTNTSENICFLLPCEKAPSFLKFSKSNIEVDIIDYHNVSITVPFQAINWRGLKKYLHIVAYVHGKVDNETIIDLSEDNLLKNSDNSQEGTFFLDTSKNYWARVYQYHHFMNIDIEKNYVNSTFSCDMEPFLSFLKIGRDVVEVTTNLSGLHPYTTYTFFIQMCNEIGCNTHIASIEGQTKEYKPTTAPQNVSIQASDKDFHMVTNWSTVDEFSVNGVIQSFHLNYSIERLNKTGSEVLPSGTFFYLIKDVGKYEEVCFQVASKTGYPEIGVFSNTSCAHSKEAAPDIAPDFQVLERSSTSFFIEISKPTNVWDLNGVVRSINVKYNVSLTDYTTIQYNISHSEFFETTDAHVLVLSNLLSYMYYDMSLAYVTVSDGPFSQSVIKRTNIDAPSHPPKNLSLSYDESSFTLTWNHLPIESWNGPGVAYNITLFEYQIDGSISSRIIFVPPDLNAHYQGGLFSYRKYNISISACTRVGCSNYTNIHFRTNESEPCPPPRLERIKSILNKLCLTWYTIPRDCINGVLHAYVVYVKQITIEPYGIERTFNYEVDQFLTESCVKNIPQGRLYNVSVAGRTGGGIGNQSNVFSSIFGDIIHGGWTPWTEWTPCTKSCGNATKMRERFCSNPTPVNGKPCSGHLNETEFCDLPQCPGLYLPAPGEYDCNEVCENHKLKCNNKIYTGNHTSIFDVVGLPCINDPGNKKDYNYDFHPSYNLRDKTCEGFIMKNNDIKCTSSEIKNVDILRICNCKDPVAEGLSEWYPWSPCLQTCGETLVKTRKRECIIKEKCKPNAKLFDEMSCGLKPCPIDGAWGNWKETNECSKTCNIGYKVRVRSCTNPAPDHGGKNCPGPDEDRGRVCNPHPCPINGGMSLWSNWGACGSTCGVSKRERSRFCNNPIPKYKGLPCPRMKEIQEDKNGCFFDDCPPLDIILICHITNRKWHFTMYQISAEKARSLEKEICDKINASLSNSTKLLSCRIKSIRKGSVIPTVLLSFEKINRAQIVSFVDNLSSSGMIGDLKVEDYSINMTSIPYEPLKDVNVESIGQNSINISWTLPSEDNSNTHVYVIYIEDDVSDINADWHIDGVESNKKFLILNYLKPNQIYRAYMVRSNNLGHGVPSQQFFIRVSSSKPATYPFNVDGFAVTSTSIYMKWNDIPKIYQNGLLNGYLIKYRKLSETSPQIKFIEYGFLTSTITGLEPFTFYQVDVSGVNAGGEGPADYVMIETLEGAPSVPVPNVVVKDMQSIKWWSVSWSSIPKNKVHGILRGYRLKYYKSYRSDVPIGREKKWITKTFDQFTFFHKEKNLVNYATYNVTVTAFTNAGEGPKPEYFAKTCRCRKLLFGNWYELHPYTIFQSPSNLSGLFPDLIKETIIKACGSCEKYKQSKLHLLKTKYGRNPNKYSAVTLKMTINDDVDVSFPYYEHMDRENIVPGTMFVPLIKSTGCAFIIRDEVNIAQLVLNLVLNVVKVWPLLLVSYIIAGLCGFLVWFTDQFMNPEEFVIGSSIKGPCIGFWFSFVTMTTVGYGDLAPKSKTARSISMLWFLIGLILNGIVIGFITTALTSLDQPETASLYNAKTAALNRSYEYRLAVRRNAKVSDLEYTTIDSMLDDLQDKKVDAVLIDIYSLVGYTQALTSRYLKIKAIINTRTAYGIILSGLSVHLKKDIESSLYAQNDVITAFVKSIEKDIPSLSEEKRGDVMQLVFGASSQIFKDTVVMMLIILAGLLVVGTLYETVRLIRSRYKIKPQEESCSHCMELEMVVDHFVDSVTTRIEKISSEEERDLIYLANLSYALKRYEAKFGKEAARARVRWMWS